MYYRDILHSSVQYGEGSRVVLVVGNRSNGITFGGEEAADIFQELSDEETQGLTITGDDLFERCNQSLLVELCKACKEDYPDKTIWCITGREYIEIKSCKLLKYIDVLVDKTQQIFRIQKS